MEDQFITYGTAEVMVENVTYGEAQRLYDLVAGVKGVQSVSCDNTTDHYSAASALYSVTFDYDEEDDECLTALDAVKETLSGYDLYISTDLGNTLQETIASEVSIIMVYVAVIVVAVLLFTSQTYGEVPVLLLTFVTAMILNQGSSFLLGTISFVSNSVTSILQLALSLTTRSSSATTSKSSTRPCPVREAAIAALSKAIPEISASSLTTVGGLGGHAVHAVQDRSGHGHLPYQGHSLRSAVRVHRHARTAGIVRAFDRKDRASGLYPENLFRRKICVGKP